MSLLGRVKTGRERGPALFIVAGADGLGKTTFAGQFPEPFFFDVENGADELGVPRLDNTVLASWPAVLEAMREVLGKIKDGEWPYKTLVFDTVDHLEHLLWHHLCELEGVTSIDDVGGGYGKGYNIALNEWRRFVKGLEALRAAGQTCVLIAHTHEKTYKNPLGEDYDRHALKMNAKAAAYLRERADAVGFVFLRTYTKKDNPKNKMETAKAISTKERFITFQPSAGFTAKTRFNLPDELPLTYDALKQALEAA